MTKDEFYVFWKHLLVDLGISERQAAERMGIQQQAVNRKAKDGTIRVTELQTLLETFGKTIAIKDKG